MTRWVPGRITATTATMAAIAAMTTALGASIAAADETADVRLTKTATYPTVRMGGLVTYTVTVTNLGPGTATAVVFGDPMPDQLNLVESTCGSVSAFCTIDSLPVGRSATLNILAVPITNLADEERVISNTAFTSSTGTIDPNPGNDQSSDIVEVVGALNPCADPRRVCIAPHRILFGTRPLGVETLRGATITNTSGRNLSLLVEGGLPDDFGFGLLPGSTCPALSPGGVLAAGESCRVVVRFTPSETFVGIRQKGTLTVTMRSPVTGNLLATRTIAVVGRGSAG